MKRLLRKFREWRDRRFRERIDKVYFHHQGDGIRKMQGWLVVLPDPQSGLYGEVWVNQTSDKLRILEQEACRLAEEYNREKESIV